MPLSETLTSALRALSSLPNIKAEELIDFSEGLALEAPLPDGSHGADPIWRIPNNVAPHPFFEALITRSRATTGIVSNNGYFALRLLDCEIIVTERTLKDILHDGSHAEMTNAEFRLAGQLLEGLDLKQAALADGIGYETKRSQMKSLSGKLYLRGQAEVIRCLTLRMMNGFAQLAKPQSSADIDSYAAAYLPQHVRRLTIVAPDGRTVPVLEYGPVTGAPLVVLHPMFFPPIGPEEIKQAEALGLRLIWPLRPGFLHPDAPILKSGAHLAASTDGLVAVLDQLVGAAAPVLAFVSSGAVATRAASQRPELVKSISFIATCYSAGRSTASLPYFGAELVELALRNEAVLTRTVATLRKYVSRDRRFQRMFETVFRRSARDLDHIAIEFDGADQGERLRLVTLTSPESIKHDFFNQTQFEWAELKALNVPRRFYHGADDSIHPPDKLAKILNTIGEQPVVVDQTMGHLPHYSDLRRSIAFAAAWQIQN
ncbi:alpha/beta fold hydrolase [Algirhabdus cladophorae]|uniref:alpha/beta fold hydrolase n=1 Tax=Algirhabdus cladophorae TaxID=3377108 RepID=UPI003B849200